MRYCALPACILLLTLTSAAAINPNAGTTGFNFLKIGVGTPRCRARRGLCGRVRQHRSLGLESGRAFRLERAHGRARLQQLFRRFPSRLRLHRRPQGVSRTRPERPLRILRRLAAHRRRRARFGDLLSDRPRRVSVRGPTARAGLAGHRRQSKSRPIQLSPNFLRTLISPTSASSSAPRLRARPSAQLSPTSVLCARATRLASRIRCRYTSGWGWPIASRTCPCPCSWWPISTCPNDNDSYLSFGLEVQLAGGLYIRPGYTTQQTGAQDEDPLGLSAGAGLTMNRYAVDYAYSSSPDLGHVHRVSVIGTF